MGGGGGVGRKAGSSGPWPPAAEKQRWRRPLAKWILRIGRNFLNCLKLLGESDCESSEVLPSAPWLRSPCSLANDQSCLLGSHCALSTPEVLGQPEGDMELGAEMPGDLEEEESRGGHPGERLQNSTPSRPRQPVVSFATTKLPQADCQSPCPFTLNSFMVVLSSSLIRGSYLLPCCGDSLRLAAASPFRVRTG